MTTTESVLCAVVAIWIVVQVLRHMSLVRRVEDLEERLMEPRGCSHPDVENVGTFGQPEYVCTICRVRVE